jgi:hypothetical protein
MCINKLSEDFEFKANCLKATPEKIIWNKLVNQVVNDYWIQKLITEAKSNVTLQYLSYEDFEMGKPHNIWKSCGSELKSQYQVKNSLWHIHFKLKMCQFINHLTVHTFFKHIMYNLYTFISGIFQRFTF